MCRGRGGSVAKALWQSASWIKACLIGVGLLWGCSAEGPERDTQLDAGLSSLRGELVVYIADHDDGTTEKQYFLRLADDALDERRLIFTADPELPSGVHLELRGVARGDAFEVAEFQLVRSSEGIGSKSEALINA